MNRNKAIKIVTELAQERIDNSYEGDEGLEADVIKFIGESEKAINLVIQLNTGWCTRVLNFLNKILDK